MNNPFQIFTSPIFGDVRAAYLDGVAWFVGKDVCHALDYVRPDKAISQHVAEEDKRKMLVPILDGTKRSMKEIRRYTFVINESGLYSLVLASQMPAAQEFKHWITAEVVPSIVKTGSYSLFNPLDDDIPFNKRFSIHARNAEARDFKAFKKAQRESAQPVIEPPLIEQPTAIEPPQPDWERLLELAEKFHDPQLRDKVLIHVINNLCGQNIF
ncbi:MAG: hypothetical protein IJP68_05920 [Selenomonadaceae bacterium]|nr:hypothetical protein [Selenomonadaceae bacterium]